MICSTYRTICTLLLNNSEYVHQTTVEGRAATYICESFGCKVVDSEFVGRTLCPTGTACTNHSGLYVAVDLGEEKTLPAVVNYLYRSAVNDPPACRVVWMYRKQRGLAVNGVSFSECRVHAVVIFS